MLVLLSTAMRDQRGVGRLPLTVPIVTVHLDPNLIPKVGLFAYNVIRLAISGEIAEVQGPAPDTDPVQVVPTVLALGEEQPMRRSEAVVQPKEEEEGGPLHVSML